MTIGKHFRHHREDTYQTDSSNDDLNNSLPEFDYVNAWAWLEESDQHRIAHRGSTSTFTVTHTVLLTNFILKPERSVFLKTSYFAKSRALFRSNCSVR